MGVALTDLIDLLIEGLTQFAGGIASGVNSYVTALLFETTENQVTGLSAFGGAVAIFAAIGLAVGITTLIFNWIRSLGN